MMHGSPVMPDGRGASLRPKIIEGGVMMERLTWPEGCAGDMTHEELKWRYRRTRKASEGRGRTRRK